MQGCSTWTNILGSAVIIKCFQRVALRVASFTGEADELACLLEKISKSSSSTALGCHGTSSTSHTFNNSLPWLLSNFCFNGKSPPFLPQHCSCTWWCFTVQVIAHKSQPQLWSLCNCRRFYFREEPYCHSMELSGLVSPWNLLLGGAVQVYGLAEFKLSNLFSSEVWPALEYTHSHLE